MVAKPKVENMEEVSEFEEFDEDPDGVSEEEEGDSAAAVKLLEIRQRRGDLPKKDLLKVPLSEAVEARMKGTTEKGMLILCTMFSRTFRPMVQIAEPLVKTVRNWVWMTEWLSMGVWMDLLSQFDGKACEEEQEKFDKKTTVNVWFAGAV